MLIKICDTYQLHSRQVFFPPEILLDTRPKQRQQIIRIHYNVDERVHKGHECNVSTWKIKRKLYIFKGTCAPVNLSMYEISRYNKLKQEAFFVGT
jgi:hypothetical protein